MSRWRLTDRGHALLLLISLLIALAGVSAATYLFGGTP